MWRERREAWTWEELKVRWLHLVHPLNALMPQYKLWVKVITLSVLQGRIDGGMNGWIDEWVDGCMDRWVNGWMNGWMDR